MNKELEQYIETEILPRYNTFDRAHRMDHARIVIDRSLALAKEHDADPQMAYTVAAYHDMGLAQGRDHHHLTSGEMLIADLRLRQWFSHEQLAIMREAVEDHRASLDHAPRNLYGLIVAEADREIDPQTILRRTIQYGLAHSPNLMYEEHYERMREHLTTKYAEGGYLRLWLPEPENLKRLNELRAIMRDELRLRKLFEELYVELYAEQRSDNSSKV